MLELAGLIFIALTFGVLFLAVKLVCKLLLLPLTLGLWVGKILFGLVFTVIGGIALVALLPLAVLALPLILITVILGIIALPVVLLVKIFV
jgi:hypothetical protein